MNMETKDLENAINKWFEMKYQTYDKLEHDGSIYLYDEGQEYADIRIDKKYKFIYYKWGLYEEFYQIIPLHSSEFEEFISKWVGDTFGFKGFTPEDGFAFLGDLLEIPLV